MPKFMCNVDITHPAGCYQGLAIPALPVTDKNSTAHRTRLQRTHIRKENDTLWEEKSKLFLFCNRTVMLI